MLAKISVYGIYGWIWGITVYYVLSVIGFIFWAAYQHVSTVHHIVGGSRGLMTCDKVRISTLTLW